MTTSVPHKTIDDVRKILVEFGLPLIVIIVCMVLLLTGVDGEVKAILAMAGGWLFKSGYTTVKNKVT